MRFHLALAALAATTAFVAPAAAQSTDQIRAEALIIQPATLQGVDDLSFGTIIATAAGSGTVTINPNDGSRSNTGSGLTLSSTNDGQRGRFLGNGNQNQTVTLVTNFPTFLENVADTTQTVEFSGTLDTAAADLSVNTGNTGVFYIGVGGTITIDAGQMPGLYEGEVELTANFQ